MPRLDKRLHALSPQSILRWKYSHRQSHHIGSAADGLVCRIEHASLPYGYDHTHNIPPIIVESLATTPLVDVRHVV